RGRGRPPQPPQAEVGRGGGGEQNRRRDQPGQRQQPPPALPPPPPEVQHRQQRQEAHQGVGLRQGDGETIHHHLRPVAAGRPADVPPGGPNVRSTRLE